MPHRLFQSVTFTDADVCISITDACLLFKLIYELPVISEN